MKKTVWIVTCGLAAMAAAAQPLEECGRQLLADYGYSLLPIRAVIRLEAPGLPRGPQEREVAAWGTVVAGNGLTVISATALSPFSGLTEAFERSGIRPTTSVSQIRIRRRDGLEVPARQILTDEELDITFLLPESDEDRARSWPKPVVFTAGVQARAMDKLIGLAGTGEMFQWIPLVGSVEVNGVVEQPRRMYLIARPFSNMTGMPVFLADGRPLGLTVIRREAVPASTGQGAQVQQAIVVLPADDLAEMMTRALEAARTAGETKKETP